MLQLTALDELRLQPEQSVISANEFQACLDAQAILDQAREAAEQIGRQAQEEYARKKQQGYEDGLQEGRLEMAEKMVDSVSKTVDYFSDIEDQIVRLVQKAVRKVLGDLDDRERVVAVVRQALSVARNQKNVLVRINPAETETVQQQVDAITGPYPGVHFLEVVADARVGPGGCILETELGVVDARLETQLQAIEQSLAKSFGSHGDS